jgi:outer membrane lipoprotein-sorting protein
LRSAVAAFIAASAVAGVPAAARAQDATEIVRKSDDLMRGASSEAELSMTIIKPSWSRTIETKVWSKGTDYSLILVTEPQRDKGSVFLKRKADMWNWIPSIERTVKIPPSMMMQSWMGSDFTNDDMFKEYSVVTDYTHKLLGDEAVDGEPCYKIEGTPKPAAAVVWGRVILWIAKQGMQQRKVEYYDEGGQLVNVMLLGDVKRMDDRDVPTHLVMYPANKKGHRTEVVYKYLHFNRPIGDDFFSYQNMKRPR